MKNFALRSLRLGIMAISVVPPLVVFAIIALLTTCAVVPATAQETPLSIDVGGVQVQGLPQDWISQRLIFSNPGTEEDAVRNGTHERWLQVVNNPRYVIQQLKRHAPAQGPAAEQVSQIEAIARANDLGETGDQLGITAAGKGKLKKDWTTNLGKGAPASLTGTIGTLSSSSISSSSILTVDGVAFDASPPVAAAGQVTISTNPTNSEDVYIEINNDSSDTYAFHDNLSDCGSAKCVMIGSNRAGTATNLAAAIGGSCLKLCTAPDPYVTATHNNSIATLTAITPGTGGNSIALAAFDNSGGNITLSGSTLGTGTGSVAGSDGVTSGTNSPPTFAYWSVSNYVSSSQLATNVASALNTNTTTSPVITATANSPASGNVTIAADSAGTGGNSIAVSETSFSAFTGTGNLTGGTTATVQPTAFPATYQVSTSPSCSDWAVYPTGWAGSNTQANFVGYKNLYTTTCSGAPTVNWAYNTGTGYTVTTSPILSPDGSKIAFVQSNGTVAQLVVLKWAPGAGTLTSPIALSASTNITTCIAPCMTVVSFADNDTYSSPVYVSSDDVVYVGDDDGYLDSITPVFNGPVPVTSIGLGLNSVHHAIASPNYDYTSGCVFVGDVDGYLYSVDPGISSGLVCKSGRFIVNATSEHLSNGTLTSGIFDAPLVDGSVGSVYVFVTASAALTSTNCATAGVNCIDEFPTNFSGSAAAPSHNGALGTGGAGYNLYDGNFDNVYYESTGGTGNLYALGNTSVSGGATLYKAAISSGAMGTVTSAVAGLNSGVRGWPSPATEFCNNGASDCTSNGTITNGGTDYLFFSINGSGKPGCTSGAGHGCVLSYNISNPAMVTQAGNGLPVTAPGTNGCWATGGFVVDNTGTAAGESQIYSFELAGAGAGGLSGSTYTSTNCTNGAGPQILAVQAAQKGE